jgi:hypothetical protein
MKTQLSLIAGGITLAGLAFACGGGGSGTSSTGTNTSTATDTGNGTGTATSITTGTLTVPGALLVLSDGVLPPGATATVLAVEPPAEFAADTVGEGVSKAYDFRAIDAAGAPIEEALKPFELGIDLSTALHEGEDHADGTGLCIVMKNKGGLFVWRAGGFTATAAKVTLSTNFFGVYQVVDCGDKPLKDFVLQAGEEPAGEDAAGEGGALSCDFGEEASICIDYPAAFAGTDQEAKTKSACEESSAVFRTEPCTAESRVGKCAVTTTISSDDAEISLTTATSYYEAVHSAEQALADCQKQADDSDSEDEGTTYTHVFTDAEGTETTLEKVVSNAMKSPFTCKLDASTQECRKYVGTYYEGKTCADIGGSLDVDACGANSPNSTADFLGVCSVKPGSDEEFQIFVYEGNSMNDAAKCETSYGPGTTWSTELPE